MPKRKISKKQILEATASVIADKGLDKATVDDVVRQADIAKGSLYTHFDSKDQLLEEGIKYLAKQRIVKLREALRNVKSPKQKLKLLLKANDSMMKKDPDAFLMNYALLLSSHKGEKRKIALEYLQRYIALVAEIIDEGIEQKEFREVDANSIATSLVISNDLTGIVNYPKLVLPKVEKLQSQLIKLISK
jgi:AcrR family transcriptional regulator